MTPSGDARRAPHYHPAFDPARGFEAQGRALSTALRLGEPKRLSRALVVDSFYQAARGQIRTAGRRVARGLAIATSLDDPHLVALACLADAVRRPT